MLVNFKDKIKGYFIPQMPSEWIVKLSSNSMDTHMDGVCIFGT